MLTLTTNVSVAQTIWIGSTGTPQPFLISMYLYTITPTLAGLVTITVRWNDGLSAKQHTEVLIATALGNFRSPVFPVWQDAGTDVTYEVTVVGGATVGLVLGYSTIN